MSLQGFVDTYTGKPNVGDTPENRGQCVGLVEVWFDTQLSPHVWGNAKDLYANAGSGYTKGTAWPAPRGSAGVMDGSWGGGVGHTWVSLGSGQVFEQNNPTGHAPKVSNYGSPRPRGYVGWILPNNFKEDTYMPASQDKVDNTTVQLEYNNALLRDASPDEIAARVNSGETVEHLQRELRDSAEHQEVQRLVGVGRDTEAKGGLKDQLSLAQLTIKDLQGQPVSEDQAASVVAQKANPIVDFLRLVVSKLTKKN